MVKKTDAVARDALAMDMPGEDPALARPPSRTRQYIEISAKKWSKWACAAQRIRAGNCARIPPLVLGTQRVDDLVNQRSEAGQFYQTGQSEGVGADPHHSRAVSIFGILDEPDYPVKRLCGSVFDELVCDAVKHCRQGVAHSIEGVIPALKGDTDVLVDGPRNGPLCQIHPCKNTYIRG